MWADLFYSFKNKFTKINTLLKSFTIIFFANEINTGKKDFKNYNKSIRNQNCNDLTDFGITKTKFLERKWQSSAHLIGKRNAKKVQTSAFVNCAK